MLQAPGFKCRVPKESILLKVFAFEKGNRSDGRCFGKKKHDRVDDGTVKSRWRFPDGKPANLMAEETGEHHGDSASPPADLTVNFPMA
jgi:hypothetical protein